jgi:streptogramin lyase
MRPGRAQVLVVSLVLAIGACARDPNPSDDSPSASPPTSQELPPSVPLGAEAWSAAYGFGGAWIQVDPPVDQVVKVDEGTGEVTVTVQGGRDAAIAQDGVWIAAGSEVRKIDPMTGEVLVSAPVETSYVAVGAGSVWVPSGAGVWRLDPRTAQVKARIPLDGGVTEIAVSGDDVWVTDKEAGTLTRIDARTDRVVAVIETGSGAHGVVAAADAVWVANYQANTVSRVDPRTDKVVATIDDVGSGVGLAWGDGALFVSAQYRGVSRIDPATNTATVVLTVPEWTYGLAYGDDELWVTSVEGQRVYRLDHSLLAPED